MDSQPVGLGGAAEPEGKQGMTAAGYPAPTSWPTIHWNQPLFAPLSSLAKAETLNTSVRKDR